MNDHLTDQAIRETKTHPDGPLNEIARRIACVEIQTPLADVLQTRSDLAYMMEQIRALDKSLDEHLIQWIEANGAIEYGTKRLYVGTAKTTKCRALRPAMEALLNACGGDWDHFCECLASGAIKYGAARTVLGDEEWSKHFEVIEHAELREGKPEKKLLEVDTKFMPKRKGKTTDAQRT